jgi:hypothetical protein
LETPFCSFILCSSFYLWISVSYCPQLLRSIRIRVFKKNPNASWGPVAHTCNPSYLGGWDQEDHGSKASLGKKSLQDPISTKKSWVWWHEPITPAMAGSLKQDGSPGQPGQKVRPYF